MWTAPEILDLRTRLNLGQAEFAKLVGVDVRTVSRWETGAAKPTGAAEAVLNAVREKLKSAKSPDAANDLIAFIVGAVAIGGLAYLLVKLLDSATEDND